MNEEKYCKGCGIKLQDENVLQEGYTVSLEQDYCQRCFRIKNYGDYQVVTKSNDEYIDILKKVSELNEQQSALLDDEEFDGDKLQSNMESKAAYIDELNSLDEGFQAVFDRVKEDVEEYKANYKELIIRLQELIREATSLSATIQAQESRNKVRVDMKFRQLKSDAKTAKRSVSMANRYYQNMSKISSEPQFMDQKK